MTPVVDVALQMRATVTVADAGEALRVRMRIQEALERVTEPIDEYGGEYAADNVYSAQLREEG
jgi:hypothetical protein